MKVSRGMQCDALGCAKTGTKRAKPKPTDDPVGTCRKKRLVVSHAENGRENFNHCVIALLALGHV